MALACGAHGVKLPGRCPPPRLWRQLTPPGFVLGVSCHDEQECLAAGAEGADFVLLAPIYAPRSKPLERPPLGLERLSRICRATTVPGYALGGIDEHNAAQCVAAGAAGVAAITLFLPSR
jgi:thiamine-phosphate pyrophosphorylase